jgi:hypothetical protein
MDTPSVESKSANCETSDPIAETMPFLVTRTSRSLLATMINSRSEGKNVFGLEELALILPRRFFCEGFLFFFGLMTDHHLAFFYMAAPGNSSEGLI